MLINGSVLMLATVLGCGQALLQQVPPLTSHELSALHHVGVGVVDGDLKAWKETERERGPSGNEQQSPTDLRTSCLLLPGDKACSPSLLQPLLGGGQG